MSTTEIANYLVAGDEANWIGSVSDILGELDPEYRRAAGPQEPSE